MPSICGSLKGARELLSQMGYDYYTSGANDQQENKR
jgi:hypothetical protein